MAGIKVESFDFDASGTSGTYSLSNTVGSLSNGFVRKISSTDKATGPVGTTGNTTPNSAHCGIELTGPTTLSFDKFTTNTQKVVGEVWRYTANPGGQDEFIVRGSYALTMDDGEATATATVAGLVNKDRAVPIHNGCNSEHNNTLEYDSATAAVYINGSGEVVATRQDTLETLIVYVTVVEFTGGNWSVGHGFSGNHDSSTQTVTLNTDSTGQGGSTFDVGSWTNAMIIDASMQGDNGGETGLADVLALVRPSSTSSVTFSVTEADGNARNDGDGYVHVIVNSGLSCYRAINTNLSEGNNTYGTIGFPTGTPTDRSIDELSMEWFVSTSGTGTAHARGRLTARITDAAGTIQHWVHRTGNTVRAYFGVVDLTGITGVPTPNITDADSPLSKIAEDSIITGNLFGTTQGTGKLELWDDAAGTTRVAQTIDSWSDTSIQFDVNAGTITDGIRYFVVTDDAGVESSPYQFRFGLPSYASVVGEFFPDHYWSFDSVYDDLGYSTGNRPLTTDIVGTHSFPAAIAEDATNSWTTGAVTGRRGCSDVFDMNITNALEQRTMGGWVQLNEIQSSLSGIYKEGGNVNNIAFLVGVGNVLMAQLADTGDDNVQAYSDFRLAVGRPYHIMFKYDYNTSPKEFRLYIDGRIQTESSGNPLTSTHLDTHSGDVNFGAPDLPLDMGSTDVTFVANADCYYNHWATWSEEGSYTGALPEADILRLFRRGAVPDDTITPDTQANMQSALEATPTVRNNAPLSYRIDSPLGGGDLELTFSDVVFDDGITEQIEWRGDGTLTVVVEGTTNFDVSKSFSPLNGIVLVEYNVPVRVNVFDIDDGTPVPDARVYLTYASGGSETTGDLFINDTCDVNGELSTTFRYASDQPIEGRVRRASTGKRYKTSDVISTIGSSGVVIDVFLIGDE